ncbi:PAS domain S-box protein [Pedobacter nyackensis]|uniref:sensor histidine kinase n=1 Tax=Pedobacter nyackensis TaxID=475255 RepID=UPI002930710E|nr:PAS domain S-box protein [Pedobacter nyackensis]
MKPNYSDHIASNKEKQAHPELEPSVDNILEGLSVAVYTCDSTGYINSYNQEAVRLWGKAPEIGKDLWCGFPKIFWADGSPMAPEECPMSRALKKGLPIIDEEIIIQSLDGVKKNIRPNPVPLLNNKGEIIGAVSTLIDITEQKQAEQKQAMLAAIIESSDDAIISKTLDGNITSWNKAAERLFGYTENEVLGKHISLLIPKERLNEENLIIDKIRSNKNVSHFETFRVAKDGHQIPISLTISPIRNSKGNVIGASKIARDISAQKNAEAELQKLYEDIKTLNTKKDEFIGLASHELKTPITSINAFLQLIERSLALPDPNKVLISKARNQLSKLTSLIADLLDVSKIQTGKLPFQFSRFDFTQIIVEVIEIMQQTNPSHQLKLLSEINECIIEADQQRIEQVLINLISNAIKYAPDSKDVIIKVNRTSDNIRVSVQDFGMGIDPIDQQQIFARFYRVEKLATHVPGLGIGLYISHEIITRHRGKIWVESGTEKGSTFIFEIPFLSDCPPLMH